MAVINAISFFLFDDMKARQWDGAIILFMEYTGRRL